MRHWLRGTTVAETGTRERREVHYRGWVQGVGFRPFVHNLARDEDLVGFVANTSSGVVIEVQGPAEAVAPAA